MTDLLIAGAGPAGLLTALHARAAGLTVQVVDPRTGSIDKACGEGLMPGAVRLLAGLGLEVGRDVPGQPFHGIRYLDGDSRAETRFRTGTGWGVRRDLLHRVLAAAADDRGVVRTVGAVHDIRQTPSGISATVRTAAARTTAAGTTAGTTSGSEPAETTVSARYLVAADGLHSPIRRSLGLQQDDTGPARWGLRRHVSVAPWTDLVEVHWSPHAEAYVTPVGPDQVSVALLTDRRGSFDDQLTAFPALAARLAGHPADDVRGAGPLRQRVSRRVAGRVLLVGDAAGYVDALTGEGIDVAARSAQELVRCLVAGRPDAYERAWSRQTRRYRWITGSLLAARRREPVRRHLVGAAARLPRVFDVAVDQLTR